MNDQTLTQDQGQPDEAKPEASVATVEPAAEPAQTPTEVSPEPEAAEPTPTPEAAQPVAEPEPDLQPQPSAEPEPEAVAASEPVAAQEPEAAQAPVPAPAPPIPPAVSVGSKTEDEMLFDAAMASLDRPEETDTRFKKLAKGDYVEATVIQVEKDRVFVDLGTKSEGVVPLPELTDENIETAHGHVKVGDKIRVVVLRPEGAEGNPIVSKKRADFEETWNRIVDSQGEGKIINAMVVDRVKGGLVVDIGVRGFVPATHVGNGKLRNIEKYVGQSIDLKILEIDRERKKVVLSNRLAEEEKRAEIKDRIFKEVSPGDVLEGSVRRLTDYGAFVDLGGIDGLLHISEMSWMRINHPSEVLKEGQDIKVMVLRLDATNNKISLGLRQVLPDPWTLIRENYRIGQKIQCTINRLVQSGAFVKLPEGAEAFLPVSEIANRRINKPSDVLAEGQEVELTIIDLRPDERRMVLSLRGGSLPDAPPGGYPERAGGGYGDDGDGPRRGGGPGKKGGKGGRRGPGGRRSEEDEFDGPLVGRVPTGGATIGERLGMLKGFLGRTEEDDADEAEKAEADAVEADALETKTVEPETVETKVVETEAVEPAEGEEK